MSGSAVQAVLKDNEANEKAKAKDILQFYLDNYSEVYQLICDGCKEVLALEIVDLSRPNPNHHQARQVVPLTPKLKSSRPRLDGAMGYQCDCGNDTRWAKIEWEAVRHGGAELPPHEVAKIKDYIAQRNHHPDIRLKGKDVITETFRVRRIK